MERLGFQKKEKPEKIGCGNKACAYLPAHGDSVVKLTSDPRDARICFYLMKLPGGTPPWAIPSRAVYRLSNEKYVICSAKAEKLPEAWKIGIDTIFRYTADAKQSNGEKGLRAHQWPVLYDYIMNEVVRDEVLGGIEALGRTQLMRKSLGLIDEVVRAFASVGLDFADFNSGNFGWYAGRAVIIDCGGISAFKPGQRPPVSLSAADKVSLPSVLEIPVLPF